LNPTRGTSGTCRKIPLLRCLITGKSDNKTKCLA
jgi:hypothetical protein